MSGRGALTTALEVIGLVLIPAGVALIYLPASLIVAGVLLICASLAITFADNGTPRDREATE